MSTAEDRVGGWLQWSWAQTKGIPLGQSSSQSGFCMFFLVSDMNANHGINTHTCLSLLAQPQHRPFCSAASFCTPQQLARHRVCLELVAATLPWTLQKPVSTATSASLGEWTWCCLSGLKRVHPTCSVDFFLSAIFIPSYCLFET